MEPLVKKDAKAVTKKVKIELMVSAVFEEKTVATMFDRHLGFMVWPGTTVTITTEEQ